jgi:hypothetical protein
MPATKAILICKLGCNRLKRQVHCGFIGWDIRSNMQLFPVQSKDIRVDEVNGYT